MSRLFYPAVFHAAQEGGFWVSFPDLPECLTEGENMEQAYSMAMDALELALSGRKGKRPLPSRPDAIVVEDEGTIVLIEYDPSSYERHRSTKSVKKTLTIPEWLNEAALSAGLNFSKVLQEALMAKLNL